ncbi:MAG: cyclopropane fatty acyl phospholipid synthase [Candidatus Saccharibacteria bacterium]
MKRDKQIARQLLGSAGITINGDNDSDIQVHNENVYSRVLRQGALGLGESYMDGWWDCPNLDKFFYKIFQAKLENKLKNDVGSMVKIASSLVFNAGRKSKAFEVGQKHYDIGNDLYLAMLDQRLTYTCGYWKNARNLNQAQTAKLDLVCRKIGLQKGQTVLDIGSGWGSFIKFAADNYGVDATGITVSKEQKILADELCIGLPVTTKLQDYREVNGIFNHVVSLGMFEHVGYKNYRTFMSVVDAVLADDGLFLLHTIGANRSSTKADRWLSKYIFPNGMVPSIKQIGKSIEGIFVMEDWHNFGPDYDPTLMAWHKNFEANWHRLKQNYDERFHRMWRYYLLLSAASFRAREIQLWQIVLSKNGVGGSYQTVR